MTLWTSTIFQQLDFIMGGKKSTENDHPFSSFISLDRNLQEEVQSCVLSGRPGSDENVLDPPCFAALPACVSFPQGKSARACVTQRTGRKRSKEYITYPVCESRLYALYYLHVSAVFPGPRSQKASPALQKDPYTDRSPIVAGDTDCVARS